MCGAVTCRVCGKTTWSGCGRHIDAIKRRVPKGQWCDGKHTDAEIVAAKEARAANRPAGIRGVFARMSGN